MRTDAEPDGSKNRAVLTLDRSGPSVFGGWGGGFLAATLLAAWFAAMGTVKAQPVRHREAPPQDERKSVDDELGKRLIRETVGEREDVMATIIRLMSESARKLEVNFDPGQETRALQEDIVKHLDEAIQTAAAQRRLRRQSARKQRSDKRRMVKPQPQQRRSEEAGAEPDMAQTTPGTVDASGQAVSPDGSSGGLKETRRAWGHLPEREREELLQGSEETFLEQYRIWIEMYYKALQEAE